MTVVHPSSPKFKQSGTSHIVPNVAWSLVMGLRNVTIPLEDVIPFEMAQDWILTAASEDVSGVQGRIFVSAEGKGWPINS